MTQQELNKLSQSAYENAKAHGFHNKEYSDAHWFMLILCEVAEAVEADRKGDYSGFSKNDIEEDLKLGEDFNDIYRSHIKGSVEEELADIAIRLLDLSGLRGKPFENLTVCVFGETSFVEDMYSLSRIITNWSYTTYARINGAMAQLCAICNKYHIDLKQHILWKMEYNKIRPMLHGKKY